MSILFKNITYLDLENEKIVEDIDIYVKDKKIEKIGKNLSLNADEIYEGKLKLLVPGFCNAHSHIGMAGLRNYADDMDLQTWLSDKIWPAEAKFDAEAIYWFSLLSILEMIKSGVTSFCDMYYFMDSVAKATQESGMKALLTRGMMDIDGVDRSNEMWNLYKKYNHRDDRIIVAPGPHAIYTCSDEYLLQMRDMALDMNGIINIHLSETKKEVEDCLSINGKRPLEHLLNIGFFDGLHVVAAHCTHLSPKEIELCRELDIYPIYNPSSNLKLASGFTPVKSMLNCELKVGLGTDGSSSNNNQNFVEEIHLASLVSKAVEEDPKCLSSIEVLKMASRNGQLALGFCDSGLIKEGYRADFAIFDLDSLNFTPANNLISALTYSASASDVCATVVDGRFLMKDKKVLSLDEEKIKRKAIENANRIFNKGE